jgi:hypothetical protein
MFLKYGTIGTCPGERVDLAATILTLVREVLDSNLGRYIKYVD